VDYKGGVKMGGNNQIPGMPAPEIPFPGTQTPTISIPGMQVPSQSPYYISAQMNFIFRARMLWRDLATWLRDYMVSLYGGIGNVEAVSDRLYAIPMDYGNMLRLTFGDQVAEQYINLLVQYIALFQSLFTALKNNDVNSINNFTQQIYQNVEDRAAFLASINPFWSRSEWVSLTTAITSMHIEQARTFLTQEYEQNLAIYDRILALANIIGDYFSQGLISYFVLSQPQPVQPQQAAQPQQTFSSYF
jgi:hypothetical protein